MAKEKIFLLRQDLVHTRTAVDPPNLRKEKCNIDIRANTLSQRVMNSWNKISFEQKSKSQAVLKSALNRQPETGRRTNTRNLKS